MTGCLIASVLLLVNGYSGYSGVLLAVGAAAAVNLRESDAEDDSPPPPAA